ncbi:MAG: hypothetical protein AB1Z98_34495 [Nannocystaceae bacterium]
MGAAGSVFDFTVRATTCINCGAPARVPPEGGTIECGHCRSTLVVAPRRSEAALPDAPPLPASAYDLAAFMASTDTAGKPWPETIPVFQRLWDQARRDPDRDGGAPLFGATLMLSSGHGAVGDQVKRRAVLETALELLSDRGHRCIVRCHLARAASRLGEREAAQAWLSPCEPQGLAEAAAEQIRLTEASLANARGDHARVLELIAPGRAATGASASLGAQLRIDSLEKTGEHLRARTELAIAISRHGADEMLGWMAANELAPRTRATFSARRGSGARLVRLSLLAVLAACVIAWLLSRMAA